MGNLKHPLYATWLNMVRRCHDDGSPGYEWYGARGIKVCRRWLTSFETFAEDVGDRPPGQMLERLDPYGDYTPGNCYWVALRKRLRRDPFTALEVS
ncbi:MAG: hypothetical protein BMS9Abin01_1089 [Gammaproteobacteria bacterium]|nr:MAG: hypothetical protein BMS9Abin01_1089 [Gammaproteobacteria bacterium]